MTFPMALTRRIVRQPAASRRTAVAALVGVALVAGGVQASAAPPSSQPQPTVTKVDDAQSLYGRPQTDMAFDLAPYGYVEEEFFVSGTARTYTDPSAPSTEAPYTTRVLLRRPADRKAFSGTLVVEWLNVTAQHDQSPDWFWSYPMALREGWAYAVVSAQSAGICCSALSLKTTDPVRYGSLEHPGDDYSFDIFSQVARALESPGDVDPMAGLKVRRTLAAGHSQSASRLTTYVQSVQDDARVFDGFYIDGGGDKRYPREPSVPVIHLREEGWGITPEEPNVSRNYRLWEVAGASHADYWVLRQQFDNPERLVPQQPQFAPPWRENEEELAGDWGHDVEPRQASCVVGGSKFPKRYAVSAALYRLDEWVRTGRPAPRVPRLELDESGQVVRDEHGHARGGLRLPQIDVPVQHYVPGACQLFGLSLPMSPTTLQELYPTHDVYVQKLTEATRRAVAQGVLLPADAEDVLRRGQASTIPLYGVRSPVPSHLLPVPRLP
jgi:hypothetical protein